MNNKQALDFRDLRTIKKFAQESNGTFSEPGLRWLRFTAAENGFADAFVTIGKRVLIHVPRFNRCLEAQRDAVPMDRSNNKRSRPAG
jgi:hypothetical protein